MPDSIPILSFRTPAAFRKWLAANHLTSGPIWLRIYKKDSGTSSITYPEALDEALCYGWIDGLKNPHDEVSWKQRFTRRRAKSGWSKINTQHVERLIRDGRMKPAGQAEIDAAKKDGRWENAYNSQGTAIFPEDFLKALSQDAKAQAFFDSLNKANRYAIAYRLQTAKRPETKQKRLDDILARLSRGDKFH